MALEQKLASSPLSLRGSKPQTFGILPSNALHNLYSVDGNPNVTWNLIKGNIGMKPEPSQLDELDKNAPKLVPRGVVSKVYKSKPGLRYKDLGPLGGRY
jgi:hypothetical protein